MDQELLQTIAAHIESNKIKEVKSSEFPEKNAKVEKRFIQITEAEINCEERAKKFAKT